MKAISLLIFSATIFNVKSHFLTLGFLQEFLDTALVVKNNISENCANQLSAFKENLLHPGEEPWAIKMLDATSKIQSGILSLNMGEMGNFKECISTKTVHKHHGLIKGKYCLGELNIAPAEMEKYSRYIDKTLMQQLEVKKISEVFTNLAAVSNTSRITGPSWAICAPSVCTTEDLNYIVNAAFKKIIDAQLRVEFSDTFCQTYEDAHPAFSNGAVAVLVIFGLYVTFVIGATVYEKTLTSPDNPGIKWIVAFSICANTKKIFTISAPNHPSLNIPCLDGMRFISIIWIVIGHQYSINAAGPLTNTIDLVEWANSLHSMFFINGTLAVDTFLVIGACLTVMAYMRARDELGEINFIKYMVHRYLRLTPPLLAVIIFSATLVNYMGSGPRWPMVQSYFQDNCIKYWWSAMLYVQNFVNVQNMCVGHSWYLSIDMQMYFVAFFVFWALHKWAHPTILLFCLGIAAAMVSCFVISWNHNITAILTNIHGNARDYNNEYYLLTYTRAAPWFIGVILGYNVFIIKEDEMTIQIKPLQALAGWIACVLIMLYCVLIGHDALREEEYSRWGNALYLASIRPIWSLAVCWTIFACVVDNSKSTAIVKSILEQPCFKILNRFTYCIYLTHVVIMYMIVFAKKSPDYFSDFEMAYKFWGSFCFSLILSYMWTLLFESPIYTLEKLLFEAFSDFRRRLPSIQLCYPSAKAADTSGADDASPGVPAQRQRRPSDEFEEICLRSRRKDAVENPDSNLPSCSSFRTAQEAIATVSDTKM